MKKFNFINFLIFMVVLVGVFTVFKHFYMQPDYKEGEKAPDFISLLPDGSSFKMSEMKGTYVLLDFWGSWCGPCITEVPMLKELYSTYNGKKFRDADGFTIVSVAVEKDEKRWEMALERLQLPWRYQVIDLSSNLKFFNAPIATLYGVKQLPTKFLIDEKGQIVAVDPTPAQIRGFLDNGTVGQE